MKSTFTISVFFLFVAAKLFSQDTTRHDHYIRVNMTLADSIGIQYQLRDTTFRNSYKTLYKFKMIKSYYGVYNYPFVYVATYGEDIYHFNPLKNTGVQYWWGLSDTKEWYLGIPIYRHASNW